ncbi:MAG: guanosine polyphosphate pyrophosphohydrolase [Bacillota bacterium]|nr:guanosine polyphosphate pyrophosphohydrolase [Bacillota bacterium]
MFFLDDYFYNGDTVLKILHQYERDLKRSDNEMDIAHAMTIRQLINLLEQNHFLSSQSQRIRELYKHMANEYPFLAFIFKGRIKSVIRVEEKFNGYILTYFYNHYKKNKCFPELAPLLTKVKSFKDLIAYRIVLSIPKCHIGPNDSQEEIELKYLYQIADMLPDFLKARGFIPQVDDASFPSKRLHSKVRRYYRDYIENPSASGYRSLHITLYDQMSKSYLEIQLRTKSMDDFAEIGEANHLGYEQKQEMERSRDDQKELMEHPLYFEAYQRLSRLQNLDLSKLDVNMFGAINNQLVNDGCGLYKGRGILPLEHLSRFQNDRID